MLITLEIQQEKKKLLAVDPDNEFLVSKYNEIAQTVEDGEVQIKLSPLLYTSLVKYKDQERFQTLLNGAEYTHPSGYPIKFKGLYYIIANLVYIQYVEKFPLHESAKGFVSPKETDSFKPADKNQINSIINPIIGIVNTEFELLLQYVRYYSGTYPEFMLTKQHQTSSINAKTFRKTTYLRK